MNAKYRLITFMQLYFGGFYEKVAIQHVKFVNVHTLRVDYAVEVPVDYEGSSTKTLKRSTNVAIFTDKFYLVR